MVAGLLPIWLRRSTDRRIGLDHCRLQMACGPGRRDARSSILPAFSPALFRPTRPEDQLLRLPSRKVAAALKQLGRSVVTCLTAEPWAHASLTSPLVTSLLWLKAGPPIDQRAERSRV